MSAKLARVRQYFISRQVFETLQPLFCLTYLYGLTPFRVVKHKNGNSEIKVSCFGFCNTAGYIILYGACCIISLWQAESVVGYFLRTKISTIGDTLQICNGIITGTVIYLSAMMQRWKLLRIIDILNALDENFVNIGIRVKYSRIFRYALVMILCKTLIIGVYCFGVFQLLKSVQVTPSFYVCVTFFLQHSVLFVAICLFCFIARSFERRLVILNKVKITSK